jgi:hypothetical protein
MRQRVVSQLTGWIGNVPIERLLTSHSSYRSRKITVRVNEAKALVGSYILQRHVAKHSGLAGACLAQDAGMEEAVGGRLENRLGGVAADCVGEVEHVKKDRILHPQYCRGLQIMIHQVC